MLNFTFDHAWLVTLSLVAIALLLGLLFLIRVAHKHGQSSQQNAISETVAVLMPVKTLKHSFRQAIGLIESSLTQRSERYKLTWTLIVNGGGSQGLPLSASGLQSAFGAENSSVSSKDGIGWGFFDKGIAVQVKSDQLGDESSQDSHGVWDELLSLCQSYRPDRPLDAIVYSLPASVLLQSSAESKYAIMESAKKFNKLLWLAQNRFALQFPLYVVIDGCEAIPGFAGFASSLPTQMRRSILGWSSPFELSAPYQDRWVDQGMGEIISITADACMELSAIDVLQKDSSNYFLLPSEIKKLSEGLHVFMDELMRPSAYHDPFMLRGFYLTGDCSDAAQLLQGTQALSMLSGAPNEFQIRPAVEPAFLRDLFEKKIFAENGLVRASRTQKLRQSTMHVAVRWGTGAFISLWLVWLGLGTIKIHYFAGELVAVIDKFNQEATNALRRSKDETIDLELSKERAIETLKLLDSLNTGALWAFPMPGSWSSIDDLNHRVQKRIAEGFAKTAFNPIRLSLNAAVAEMTGATIDPSNGALVNSSNCALPKTWIERISTAGSRPVDPDEQIEFFMLEQYVRRAAELQRVIASLMRLTDKTAAASGEDLRLVVKALMGVELNGNINQIANIFRNSVSSGGLIDHNSLQQASTCAFGQMYDAFLEGALQKNSLLSYESSYSELIAQVSVEATSAFDGTLGYQAWNEFSEQLKSQSAFLQPGKGIWIQRRTPEFGVNYDKLMQTVRGVDLLGSAAVDAAQKRLNTSFTKFLDKWDNINHENAGSMVGKLDWIEKESQWDFNADRQALMENMSKMLALPYVKNNFPRKLPEAPSNSAVIWDRQRLDQALSYADVKRTLEGELLQKFPASLREQATRFVYGALASKVLESTSQAMSVTIRPINQVSLQEAEQAKLSKLISLLTDLGASDAVVALRGMISKELIARLMVLDDSFNQAFVFMPKEVDFKNWNGSGNPLLVAFDSPDASGLAAYVAQQISYIENTSREAETLLQTLNVLQPNHPLVIKWNAMTAEVSRFKIKSPISTLSVLTQFILNAGTEFELNNCLERIQKISTGRRSFDYFSDRLQSLQTGLTQRCIALKENDRKESWNRFANLFNRDLANRVPFKSLAMPPQVSQSGLSPRFELISADVDDVSAVLTSFDKAYKSLGDTNANGLSAKPLNTPVSVKKFEEQFIKVRQLFAPLYPAEQTLVSGYDLTVDFRSNQAEEKEGGRIIEWVLSSGNQMLRSRDSNAKSLFWEPGTPISLSLRVAKDSPLKPKSDPNQAYISVEDKTVTYRFTDVWALFSFISAHREPDRYSRGESRMQLLRFEFVLTPVSDTAKQTDSEIPAKVFMRIGLSAFGKKTLLAWPSVFPSKAPDWASP
ncbi:MAG: hypothetical protein EBT70_00410 [Betaproteobacteria bacterium]|nr:hypothetical protein [Betaproteobacteria bacterium]